MNNIIMNFAKSNHDALLSIKENAEYFVCEIDKGITKLKHEYNIDIFRNYAKLIAKTEFGLHDNKISIHVEFLSSNLSINILSIIESLDLIYQFSEYNSFINVECYDIVNCKISIRNENLKIFESKDLIDLIVQRVIAHVQNNILQQMSKTQDNKKPSTSSLNGEQYSDVIFESSLNCEQYSDVIN